MTHIPRIDWYNDDGTVTRMKLTVAVDGMNLRDWFAGQALSGFGEDWCDRDARISAERAYRVADYMIAVRNKKP